MTNDWIDIFYENLKKKNREKRFWLKLFIWVKLIFFNQNLWSSNLLTPWPLDPLILWPLDQGSWHLQISEFSSEFGGFRKINRIPSDFLAFKANPPNFYKTSYLYYLIKYAAIYLVCSIKCESFVLCKDVRGTTTVRCSNSAKCQFWAQLIFFATTLYILQNPPNSLRKFVFLGLRI